MPLSWYFLGRMSSNRNLNRLRLILRQVLQLAHSVAPRAGGNLVEIDRHPIPANHERSAVVLADAGLETDFVQIVIDDAKPGLHVVEDSTRVFGGRDGAG